MTRRVIAIGEGAEPTCYGYGIYALTVDGHRIRRTIGSCSASAAERTGRRG